MILQQVFCGVSFSVNKNQNSKLKSKKCNENINKKGMKHAIFSATIIITNQCPYRPGNMVLKGMTVIGQIIATRESNTKTICF